jgi:DNA-binding CsgD family transcriptional regulator
MLGDLALAEGRYEEALQHLGASREVFDKLGDFSSIASVDAGLGQVALRQRRFREAEHWFVSSLNAKVEVADTWGALTALDGLACLAAAQALLSKAAQLWGACEALRRGHGVPRSDVEQAFCDAFIPPVRAQMRERAFLDAYRTGEALDLKQAIAYALAPDDAPRPDGPSLRRVYPAGLTAREIEVLRLVAQGLTDAEVADKLVLSPRTVNAHLTSIYNKLGVNSRAAATRFAVENKFL